MADLLAQMSKYDRREVDDDLENLREETRDEIDLAEILNQDAAETLASVRKFMADNAETVAKQHKDMADGVAALDRLVKSNMVLENANEELRNLLDGPEASSLANQLAEIAALSTRYRELLLETGRNGRPPLF